MSEETSALTFEESQVDEIDVLLVDDDDACLKVISRCLRRGGFQVAVATNGKEALKLLETHKPKLIISDVMMPDMNGYELCLNVRQRGLEDIPFLFLSALGSPPERVVGLRMGADDYIVKPVDEEELLLKVRRQLKQTGKMRALRKLAGEKSAQSD